MEKLKVQELEEKYFQWNSMKKKFKGNNEVYIKILKISFWKIQMIFFYIIHISKKIFWVFNLFLTKSYFFHDFLYIFLTSLKFLLHIALITYNLHHLPQNPSFPLQINPQNNRKQKLFQWCSNFFYIQKLLKNLGKKARNRKLFSSIFQMDFYFTPRWREEKPLLIFHFIVLPCRLLLLRLQILWVCAFRSDQR